MMCLTVKWNVNSIFFLTTNNVSYIMMSMVTWTPERMRQLRARFHLSQSALGKMAGVSGNYIYMLEGGDRSPSKTLCFLLDRIERELTENEKLKGGDKHGKKNAGNL